MPDSISTRLMARTDEGGGGNVAEISGFMLPTSLALLCKLLHRTQGGYYSINVESRKETQCFNAPTIRYPSQIDRLGDNRPMSQRVILSQGAWSNGGGDSNSSMYGFVGMTGGEPHLNSCSVFALDGEEWINMIRTNAMLSQSGRYLSNVRCFGGKLSVKCKIPTQSTTIGGSSLSAL